MSLRRAAAILGLFCLLCAPVTELWAAAGSEGANEAYFPDLETVTHDGRQLRFYSDILKDKVVLIHFFYTECTTAQPALVTLFRMQKLLGDALGKDIVLLSLSVDPDKDTPEVLKPFAQKFNPQPGWLFLTGKPENINPINRALGNLGRLPEGHLQLFLLGNLKTGHWMKMLETAPAVSVAQGLKTLAAEDGP